MPDLTVGAELQVRDGATSRDLETEDFGVSRTGAGKEATQLAAVAALADAVARLGEVVAAVEGTLAVDGQVAVTNPTADPEPGLAKDSTVGRRYAGGKDPATATVTAVGETPIVTPDVGNRLLVYWVSAVNDPDQPQSPLIKVELGEREIYRAYAVAHWEFFEGAVDAPLTVTLDQPGSVAFTAHYEEV